MSGGMIVSGAAGLPRSFTVIEASSYREAIRGMKAAFQNPETALVVWKNAGDLLSGGMKEAVYKATREGQEFQEFSKLTGPFMRKSRLDSRTSEHFNKFARGAGLNRSLLQLWHQDSEALIQAIHDEFDITHHQALLRLRRISKHPLYHRDRMTANGVVAFRVLNGDSTEYYRLEDVSRKTKSLVSAWPKMEMNPDAEIWRAPHGAMAFHSASILHSAPSLQTSGGLARGQMRVTEAQIFRARTAFVACRMGQAALL